MIYIFRYIFFFIFIGACITVQAQYEEVLGNSETKFTFFVNDNDMTAEIRDDNHKIDDRKYAMIKGERLIRAFKKSSGTNTLIIPETINIKGKSYTITSIGYAAFAGYVNVDYIVLPPTIARIGDYAFFRTNIKSIELPSSVYEIGRRAFGHCGQLRSIITTMGGVRIESSCYAESEGCDVTYKNVTRPQEPFTKAIVQEHEKNNKRLLSDIDNNLPVAADVDNNTFAIIIANENYQSVAPVEYALHDGETFKQYCLTVLGISPKNIFYIPNATMMNIKHEINLIRDIANAYKGEARFLFYYAGHGFPNAMGNESYLLPIDGTGMNENEGISLSEIYQQFSNLPSQGVVMFLDACFSGSLRGEGMLSSSRGIAVRVQTHELHGNVVVFSAAQGDQTANPYHEQGHGLFTYFLLKKIKENPSITLGELNDYVENEVVKESLLRKRKIQKPVVQTSKMLEGIWRDKRLKR